MSYEVYKTQLESDLQEVISGLQTIAVENPETGDWEAVPIAEDLRSADDNEEADAVEEWDTRRAVVSELETRYRTIKRALEKIAAGTYGICEISGEPIEPERLTVNPAARTNILHRDRERELSL